MRTRLSLLVVMMLVIAACTSGGAPGTTSGSTTAPSAPPTTQPAPTTTQPAPTTTVPDEHDHGGSAADPAEIAAAALATASFQDVAAAEAAGWGSTLDGLGCFDNAELGGMGVHYLNGELMDDQVDLTTPEALVYEMGPGGEILGLIAHEYIVPVEAWTATAPPRLFGVDFHQHPVLPLWVLHVWLWKDNPSGIFQDFNPKVRMCPEGVPIFGVDRP